MDTSGTRLVEGHRYRIQLHTDGPLMLEGVFLGYDAREIKFWFMGEPEDVMSAIFDYGYITNYEHLIFEDLTKG